jgi:signal transduction histidine kinase
MTPGLDARDRLLLHRATRRIALQSAGVLAVAVTLVVITVAAVFDHVQRGEIQRTVRNAAVTADDVNDPPPGVVLIRTRDGRTVLTPGAPSALARLATSPNGPGHSAVGGHAYTTYAQQHDGNRYVAAYDMAGHHHEEVRLLWTSIAAGAIGVLLAAGSGWLIGRRAVQPLATALSLQRRFVTDASHELRTPLTVLHTRAQLVRRRLAGTVPREQLEELDQLVNDSADLGEVVGDLLLSAQLQREDVVGTAIDVGDLARSVVASLTPLADANGTDLQALVDGDELIVEGAPVALRRALVALVDNAISHTADGRVLIEVSGNRDDVEIAVADDGEGFDPADAPRLTERFSRGAEETGQSRRFGLGLALVDEVVRAHHGWMRINGVIGQGTTVTITLPRRDVGAYNDGVAGNARP